MYFAYISPMESPKNRNLRWPIHPTTGHNISTDTNRGASRQKSKCNRENDRALAYVTRDPECKRDKQVRGRLGFRDRAAETTLITTRRGAARLSSNANRKPGKQPRSRTVAATGESREGATEGKGQEESARRVQKRQKERERERLRGRIRTCVAQTHAL